MATPYDPWGNWSPVGWGNPATSVPQNLDDTTWSPGRSQGWPPQNQQRSWPQQYPRASKFAVSQSSDTGPYATDTDRSFLPPPPGPPSLNPGMDQLDQPGIWDYNSTNRLVQMGLPADKARDFVAYLSNKGISPEQAFSEGFNISDAFNDYANTFPTQLGQGGQPGGQPGIGFKPIQVNTNPNPPVGGQVPPDTVGGRNLQYGNTAYAMQEAQKRLGNLIAGESNPSKINELVQSLLGLSNISQQDFFNANYAPATESAGNIYNMLGGRIGLPTGLPPGTDTQGGANTLASLMQRINAQRTGTDIPFAGPNFQPSNVYNQGQVNQTDIDSILRTLGATNLNNPGLNFALRNLQQQSGPMSQGLNTGLTPEIENILRGLGIDASQLSMPSSVSGAAAPSQNLTEAERRAGLLTVPPEVFNAYGNTPGQNLTSPIAQGTTLTSGYDPSRVAQVGLNRITSTAADKTLSTTGGSPIDIQKLLGETSPLSTFGTTGGGSIDIQKLLGETDLSTISNTLKSSIAESFAQASRNLEDTLATRGISASTIADAERTRLADAQARAQANADLQALQIVGGERRANLGAATDILGQQFGQQLQAGQYAGGERRANLGAATDILGQQFGQNLQAGQFNVGTGVTALEQARGNTALLSNLLNQQFGQQIAGTELGLRGGVAAGQEARSNLGQLAGIQQAQFGQQLAGGQFGLQAGELQNAIQRANLAAQQGVTGDLLGAQLAGLQFGQSQALARGGEGRATAGLLSLIGAQNLQNQLGLQGARLGAIGQSEQADMARRQAEFQRMLAGTEEGRALRGERDTAQQQALANLQSLFGAQTGEAQRQYGNQMQAALQGENILNQRYQAAQQPLSMLLSALRGVNVAPGVLGQLQMPSQGPGAGEFAGQALGGLISNLPFMIGNRSGGR